jgi:diguanylate cyclase (GGDEF)-like protein
MRLDFPSGGTFGFAADDLRGFARTFAEVEWLLLVLVLLYLIFVQVEQMERNAILMALMFFGAFVLAFHYVNFFRRESLWKLALEAAVMVLFITWVVWFTGRMASPLINLYLLTIIASALTLGKSVTFSVLLVISGCYAFLAHPEQPSAVLHAPQAASLMAQLAPVLLAGYLTTMLAADIRYVVERVRLMSQTDELTGLINMRGFMPLLERETGRAQRYDRPFGLLMVDCDNLKEVNDTHGHAAGNRLLAFVVERMREVLRATDAIARYGGDEFLVLLPETHAEGARLVAERLRSAVESGSLELDGRIIPTTISVGVASYPGDGREVRELIDRADRAMYRSKQRGKNVVTSGA